MYGEALSKVTKDKHSLIDEDKVTLQDVEDDIHSESQQQVKNTDVEKEVGTFPFKFERISQSLF